MSRLTPKTRKRFGFFSALVALLTLVMTFGLVSFAPTAAYAANTYTVKTTVSYPTGNTVAFDVALISSDPLDEASTTCTVSYSGPENYTFPAFPVSVAQSAAVGSDALKYGKYTYSTICGLGSPDSGTFTIGTDTDGDNVWDDVDKCVTQPGPASNNGCPLPAGTSSFTVSGPTLTVNAPTGVTPSGATVVYKLNGSVVSTGSHTVAAGTHTLTLWVNGVQVDSDTFTVKAYVTLQAPGGITRVTNGPDTVATAQAKAQGTETVVGTTGLCAGATYQQDEKGQWYINICLTDLKSGFIPLEGNGWTSNGQQLVFKYYDQGGFSAPVQPPLVMADWKLGEPTFTLNSDGTYTVHPVYTNPTTWTFQAVEYVNGVSIGTVDIAPGSAKAWTKSVPACTTVSMVIEGTDAFLFQDVKAPCATTPPADGWTYGVWDQKHGADNVPCTTGGHWVLTGKVTAAQVSLDGGKTWANMTQNGNGSWSFDSTGSIAASSVVKYRYKGEADDYVLKLSHCVASNTGGNNGGNTGGNGGSNGGGNTGGSNGSSGNTNTGGSNNTGNQPSNNVVGNTTTKSAGNVYAAKPHTGSELPLAGGSATLVALGLGAFLVRRRILAAG